MLFVAEMTDPVLTVRLSEESASLSRSIYVAKNALSLFERMVVYSHSYKNFYRRREESVFAA